MKRWMVFIVVGLFAAGFVAWYAGRGSRDDGIQVRRIERGGAAFTVVEVDLRRVHLGLYWKGSDGAAYGSFDALRRALGRRGKRMLFAPNAGISEPGYVPTGLHVEDGRTLCPLNLKQGTGNFYLQPNGVFQVGPEGARIVRSDQFRAQDISMATQSGPMLVIGGAVNPAFQPRSPNRHLRSGVGVRSPERVVFVLSETAVTFHQLARLFVDELGCADALYLDGTISQFDIGGKVTGGSGGGFAGIIAATP